MSSVHRLVWDSEAGQIDAVRPSDAYLHSPARSPSPSPFARGAQWSDFRDEFVNAGCAPEDMSLACNLVHTYLSADVLEKPVLERINKYLSDVLVDTGLKKVYASLPDPVETGEGLEAGIEDPTAIKIRFLLRKLSEQHLAMVLRFPFAHSADRENAEWLCKMWLHTHYATRSRDRGQSRHLLYDLYANFENVFRLEIETNIQDIPGWNKTGFVDSWADLDYKPGKAHRSPTASRSSLRISIPNTNTLSGKISKRNSLSLKTPSGAHHTRQRSNSGIRLGLPVSPHTPRRASGSYTNLFELGLDLQSPNLNVTDSRRQSLSQNYSPIDRPTTPVDEAARQPWFVRNNNPNITVNHGGNYPVWKTMFAHLVAGARLEYYVDANKITVTDVLAALGDYNWIESSFAKIEHRYAIVDFAYYIFLRSRAIHSQDAGFNRADLECFQWQSVESLQLTVDRIKHYLRPVPIRPSMQAASSFLGHVSSSLQYCPDLGFQIGDIPREDETVVSYADLLVEIANHDIEMMDLDDY